MKLISITTLLFMCLSGMGQNFAPSVLNPVATIKLPPNWEAKYNGGTGDAYHFKNTELVLDTAIIFIGIDTIKHDHKLLKEDVMLFSAGIEGESDSWEEICSVCLYNFKVTKSYLTQFQIAKKKLDKIKPKTFTRTIPQNWYTTPNYTPL